MDRVTDEFFKTPVCRNCGAALDKPYCGSCGQKQADRFGSRHLRKEAWEKIRWFEGDMLKAALKVALRPGTVAREYVLGKRQSHTHPLKLLLAAIVLLLIVIAQTDYLGSDNETLSRAIELVQAYSKWSFSLGIVAILIASNFTFWKRHGFNFTEHLILATYTHFVILCASIINLLPLMVRTSPELVARHRFYTSYYMDFVEVGIVLLSFGQFFRVDWRRQWWWPAIGAAIFYVTKEGLLYLYARAVIRLVMAQLT